MATGEDILRTAAREIGYREAKNGHNKYGEWYGIDCVAWCMEFVQWVYHETGCDLPFETASCGTLLRWYREHQPECVTDKPVSGCIVIFDFPNTQYVTDHTGLFVRLEDGYITTIDGNTSNGNDSNGGYVQQRTRKLSYANPTYIVPKEIREEDMRRYQTTEEIRRDAPWAAETVEKLIAAGALHGNENGLDLSYDMLRMLVINDNMKVYQ